MTFFKKIIAIIRTIGTNEWKPVIRPNSFVPMRMRKRDDNGNWMYREPTEIEIAEFMSNEAW